MRPLFKRLVLGLLIFALASFVPAPASAAHQKVVLLTSVNTRGLKSFFGKSYFQNYVQNLEEKFRKQFEGTSYVIEMVHDADQFDLWSVLHDPTNVAVFWLSHASLSGASSNSFQLLSTHKIIDARGFDITPVFEKVHPNLRFLAVIGCFSADIMNSIPKVSHDPKHPDHPFLRLFTFHHKVDAKKGLDQAISASKKVLEIPEIRFGFNSPCSVVPGYRVRASRSFSVANRKGERQPSLGPIRPAARMMSGHHVLNVFPRAALNPDFKDQSQLHEFFLPKNEEVFSELRIDVGENSDIQLDKKKVAQLDVGKLDLSLVGDNGSVIEPWELWHMANGKPIGIFTHSFKPKIDQLKTADFSQYLVLGSEFRCEPMPSYE